MSDDASNHAPADTTGTIVPADFVLPPPPPGVRYVRVPMRAVIVIAGDDLRDRVDRFFHWPMIILALLMLPLLAWELLATPRWGTWQWWASAIGLAIVWLAFCIEFIIKIAIAESRFEYVRRNWLDLIILAMPAMRPLRIAYIARTSRVFTLRGVGMKFLRYVVTIVVGLEATDRLLERVGLKVRRGRIDPRQMTRHELMREVTRLRTLTDRWAEWHRLHQEHLQAHGTCAPFRLPSPEEDPGDPSSDPAGQGKAAIGSNLDAEHSSPHTIKPMDPASAAPADIENPRAGTVHMQPE